MTQAVAGAAPAETMGVWTCELHDSRAEWSDETWDVLGLQKGAIEASLESFLAAVHPEDRTVVERALEDVRNGGTSYDETVRIVRADGSERLTRTQAVVVRDADGVPARLVGAILDLTPIRDEQAELERSRREYETLVTSAPDVIVRFCRDSRILYINRTRTVPGPPSSLVGKKPRETGLPDHVAEAWETALERVFATGNEVDFEVAYEVEERMRWFAVRIAPEHGENEVETALAVVREFTEQREAERRFRALVESSQDVIALLSADGTIVYESPSLERVLGWLPDQLVGTNAFEHVHPDERERVKSMFDRRIGESGSSAVVEFRFRHADGSWRTLESVATNLLSDPAVNAILVTSRDVTERKRLEAQVRQSQRLEAVGQLAGGIAHDFNNILLVIRGYCQLLADRLGGTEDAADLAEISAAADRATELVAQLLAYGRRQRLEPVNTDINDVVAGVMTFLHRVIGEDVALSTELSPDLAPVSVDPAQLEQAIVNLSANARDAMPRGGRLDIVTRNVVLGEDEAAGLGVAPGEYATLSVADTGTGMDETTLGHVFEPFFTTKPDGEGTGLGLAMVHGFVAQSGGAISVQSTPGDGSTFTIFIPPTAPVAAEEAPASAPAPALQGSERILLVEDEEQVRSLVGTMLRRRGYDVIDTARPAEAIELARSGLGVDLLLTDLVMPQMGGIELARQLHEEHPEMRVLLMSGYAESSAPAGDWSDRARLLQKPFGPAELATAVREVLDSSEAA